MCAVPAAPVVDVPGHRLSMTDYVAMTKAHGRGDQRRQMPLMSASLSRVFRALVPIFTTQEFSLDNVPRAAQSSPTVPTAPW